jgi:hypothetical protein
MAKKRAKATHKKGAAKVKKQSTPTKSKGVQEKRKTSSDRVKGKGKRKRKNDDDDNDDDNDQLQKNRKESNQDNIDDYLKYHSDLKPSSKLLKDYAEIDSRAAQLMFADNSGYDYSNSAIILNELRSDDHEIREAAIENYLDIS